MHPIERLRMVARAGREDATALTREAASALASFAGEPAALVTACRRLVDRQPTCGPLWWLSAHVLAAADPMRAAWRAADELNRDTTASVLAAALPEDSTVLVLGWPDVTAEALIRRGDVRVLVIDSLDEGSSLAGWLRRGEADAELVPESGLGAAVRASDLVLVEAVALGPSGPLSGEQGTSGPLSGEQGPSGPLSGERSPGGLVAVSGSAAAAAVGRQSGIPVWAVAGAGRVLPEPLWEALAARVSARPSPWDRDEELVPLDWMDAVAGLGGVESVAAALARPTCPPAPELVRTRPG